MTACHHALQLPCFAGSPTDTRDTHAVRIAELLVDQAVNDAVLGVELVGNTVKVLRIPGLISSEYGIGDVVGELDDAGRPRIHEVACPPSA